MSDELKLESLKVETKRYIRSVFHSLALRRRAEFVVEKTCANSLRVPYVREVLPEAKYIFIVRDGRSVVPSAMKRWHSSFELGYTLRKARYVPVRDVPYYAGKLIWTRARRFFNSDAALRVWGPVFEGMYDLQKRLSLQEIVAYQWAVSVERAADGLCSLGEDLCLPIRYEDIIEDPEAETKRISSFLGIELSDEKVQSISGIVKTKKGGLSKTLGATLSAASRAILAPTLRRMAY